MDGRLLTYVRVYVAGHGVTMDSVARAMGCKRSAFYAKLDGKSPLKLGEAKRLAEAVELTLDDLWSIAPDINRS